MYFKQIDEIIAGTKTVTRRIIKPGDDERIKPVDGDILIKDSNGDLWVKGYTWKKRDITEVRTATGRLKWQVGRDYAVSPGRGKPGVWWNPATRECLLDAYAHVYSVTGKKQKPVMPNWESSYAVWLRHNGYTPLRIVITAIRRERLQDISEDDARAEGVEPVVSYRMEYYNEGAPLESYVAGYRHLWTDINGRGSWDANPEVWVIAFEVQRAEFAAHDTPTE